MGYVGSYIWKLRQVIGHDLIVAPGAVVVAVDSHGNVLLIKRSDTGDWALPGGAAEPGSTFASSAAAELSEETGLAAELSDLIAFASISDERWTNFTFPNGDVVHSFNLCFEARVWSGAPRADAVESSAVAFFDPASLPSPMLPMSARVLELWAAYSSSKTFQAG
ncbi:MAG: NUDIX domain-containing protein [Solirubrobacterales bacterium]|nr:NUDIX domain-containing protein [Solirubrobacterales bacterium]